MNKQNATAVLAFLTTGVLVDAGLETFRSGAPVRWWVIVSIAAYLLLSLPAWWSRRRGGRPPGWSDIATGSSFVLLGLLSATVWLPEGQLRGIVLLGQPTPAVLAFVTSAAVALAGVILARVPRFIPAGGRGFLALIAAYGVAACALAIRTGTPYGNLLHGSSFWKQLPFWLQGGFLGALVIIPAALVVQTVSVGLGRLRGGGFGGFRQALALVLSFALALSTLPQPSSWQGATTASRTRMPVLPEVDGPAASFVTLPPPTRVNRTPEELVASTSSLVTHISRARYDVAERANSLAPGFDPAFRFVRDRIRYEAYPGILRGADGAYAAGAGNAWDRSLLLVHLLNRKDVRTRFAIGHLAGLEAEQLFAHIFDPPQPLNEDAGVRPTAASVEAVAFKARVFARAHRDYAAVRAALGKDLPLAWGFSHDEVMRDIASHVWVQAQVGAQWIDLDSAFGDAVPGKNYCSVEQIVDTPPASAHQYANMRVTIETLAAEGMRRSTVLEVRLAAEDLLDRQVFLIHAPNTGLQALGGMFGGRSRDMWRPALWVDGEFHLGQPVTFSETGSATGGIADVFGGGPTSEPVFVAEWLEFDIEFPDGRHDVTRRVLVDRAGMVWRHAATPEMAALRSLPRDAEGLISPRTVHNIWFSAGRHDLYSYATAVNLLASSAGSPLEAPAAAVEPAGPTRSAQETPQLETDVPFGEQVWPLAIKNFAWLLWSDHVIVPALNDSPSTRFYADSPRIFVFSVSPDPQSGANVLLSESDLRRDVLRGISRNPSHSATVAERKLWFGVLEGALEHEVAAEDVAAVGTASATVLSTSSLLTAEGAVAFRPGQVELVSQQIADRESTARLQAALHNDAVAVVPRSALRTGTAGWWEISMRGDCTTVLGDLNSSYAKFAGKVGSVKRLPGGGGGNRFRPPREGKTGNEYAMLLAGIALVAIAVVWALAHHCGNSAQSAASAASAADTGGDGQ